MAFASADGVTRREWVVLVDRPGGDLHAKCLGCDEEIRIALPCSVRVLPDLLRAHARAHNGCGKAFRAKKKVESDGNRSR